MSQNTKIFLSQNLDCLHELTISLKSASEGLCVCLTDIFHCLGSGTVNVTYLLFTTTAWVQFHSSASHLI